MFLSECWILMINAEKYPWVLLLKYQRSMVHSTISEKTQQLDRKRKVSSFRDPVYLLREITSPFPREMPGRLHVRGSPNN